MASPRPLDKDLYALRHRAQELSKGIQKTMRGLTKPHCEWSDLLNEMSVISSQLINIQQDFEKENGRISQQLSKFTLQPGHSHFDCSLIGIKKMPQIVEDTNKYYNDKENEFIKNYDENEIIDKLVKYNRMLAKVDHFNSISIAKTKIPHDYHKNEIQQENEKKEEDGDTKMMMEDQDEEEKMKRKYEKYLVEFMFCGQTPEQRARMASEDPSDDEMH